MAKNDITPPKLEQWDLEQQHHGIAPPSVPQHLTISQVQQSQLNNPMVSNLSQPNKVEEFKQHKQRNQQEMQSSVGSLNGFFREQMEGQSFDYRDSDHPTAALCHFGFKAVAIVYYMFGGIITRQAWTIPEIIIVMGAIDFWVTKNVTGRLLLGLRWWEEIDEASGTQLWVFETRVNEDLVKPINIGIFWISMGAAIIIWGFLGVINFLTINILNLVSISFQLGILLINFYFFFQCSRVAKTRAKQLASVLGKEVMNKMLAQSVIWPLSTPKTKV